MLIATSLAAAGVLCAPLLSTPLPATPPTVTVTVAVAAALSPTLVTRALNEAGDIWRAAGFVLIWDLRPDVPAPHPSGLHVTIGNERGIIKSRDPNVLPLGWIEFEAESPAPQIYLSYANATALLRASEGVIGHLATMTVIERETLLGRAMGRALAHEIGHYLLASKAHTASGIMQARRGSAELFSASRNGFRLLAEQRRVVSDRLRSSGRVAMAGDWGDR